MINLEESQLVLCTVDKVIGTTVFVRIEGDGEGTITLSEIAPGRIRNLRDYVSPGKRIVCKILSIKGTSIHLSLRRVGINEKKEFLQKIDKEKSSRAIFKTVIGEKETEELINKIQIPILQFFEQIKENPKLLEDYLKKEQAEKIIKIIESKKEKPKEIRQIFKLSNKSSNGIIIIKNIIQDACKNMNCDISYLAAGKYSISIEGKDFKEINNKIKSILDSIEKSSKKNKCDFSVEKS